MVKDWYSPGEIKFSKPQILWLLPELIELRLGYYPNKLTCYTSPEYKTYTVRVTTYKDLAMSIAAELDYRIEHTPDGSILLDKYTYELGSEALCKKYNLHYKVLDSYISYRLSYISGSKRKVQPYNQWLNSLIYWRKNNRVSKSESNVDLSSLVDNLLNSMTYG